MPHCLKINMFQLIPSHNHNYKKVKIFYLYRVINMRNYTIYNVGMLLCCAYCKKVRLIYSQRKLSADEARTLTRR